MKKKNEKYGNDPHIADFPGLSIADIRGSRRQVTLTVGQRKITKSTPTTVRK